jgi:hypothetical protein
MLGRIWGGIIGRDQAASARHYPASNTNAVVTLPAVIEKRYGVTKIVWSYSGDPTAGSLTVTDGGSTIRSIAITKGGPGALTFGACGGTVNSAIVVTLAAGGVGITGTLDVEYVAETGRS